MSSAPNALRASLDAASNPASSSASSRPNRLPLPPPPPAALRTTGYPRRPPSAQARKRRALRQEPVPGVYRLAPRALRRRHQLPDVEIGLGCRRRPERNRQIGRAHMGRQAIDLRINRHRLEALLVAGADDAQGDLAAVGDQYALDGR